MKVKKSFFKFLSINILIKFLTLHAFKFEFTSGKPGRYDVATPGDSFCSHRAFSYKSLIFDQSN